MKIGDKVVFLNESGGGVVAGFKGTGIVMIEDTDGFQIPMSVKDVVVVDDNNDYSSSRAVEGRKTEKSSGSTPNVERGRAQSYTNTSETCHKESTTHQKPMEREGGDKLNVYLAFAPIDSRNIGNTSFECYLVNDSNFYVYFTFLVAEGSRWTLRHKNEVEPNT